MKKVILSVLLASSLALSPVYAQTTAVGDQYEYGLAYNSTSNQPMVRFAWKFGASKYNRPTLNRENSMAAASTGQKIAIGIGLVALLAWAINEANDDDDDYTCTYDGEICIRN